MRARPTFPGSVEGRTRSAPTQIARTPTVLTEGCRGELKSSSEPSTGAGRKRGPTALRHQLPEVRCDSCFDYSRGGSVDGTVRPAARIWVRRWMPASRTNEWTRRWQQLRGDRTMTVTTLPKEQRVVADVLVSGGADLAGPVPLVSGGADLSPDLFRSRRRGRWS